VKPNGMIIPVSVATTNPPSTTNGTKSDATTIDVAALKRQESSLYPSKGNLSKEFLDLEKKTWAPTAGDDETKSTF